MAVSKGLINFINQQITAATDPSKVYVFPLMCGLGKSSYIRYAIADALSTGQGLIVCTDTIDGLHRLSGNMDSENEEEDELIHYINQNLDNIALLYSNTVAAERPNLYGRKAKPVILMTTQRYFNLTPTEIKTLTSGALPRRKIIFDEKPYLSERRSIGMKELNDIATALLDGIDDTANQNDKDWLIDEWNVVKSSIRSSFVDCENANTDIERRSWHERAEQMTSDDDRFFKVIDRYKKGIDRKNINARKNILATYQMYIEGATFVSKKKLSSKAKERQYENYFTVTIDNTEKLQNIGAQVFVFDGTADVSPDYDLDYIHMFDCSDYRRRLDRLTIKIVNAATNKTRITRKSGTNEVNAIIRYIKKQWTDPAVFTYAFLENRFKRDFSSVQHFGNIKGRNDNRNATEIVQVGVNRFPYSIYEEQTAFNLLSAMPENLCSIQIKSASVVTKTENRSLLEDIEQNIFRSAIRNPENRKPVCYMLMMPAYTVSADGKRVENDLVYMIRERYEKDGATVEVVDTPLDLQLEKTASRNAKEQTHAQAVLSWIESKGKGYSFKLKEMLAETNLTHKQWERVKNSNKAIRTLFDGFADSDCRKGYYVIQ